MVHVRNTSMALVAQVRRIPTPLAITIGVLVGLFIARMLPGSVSQSLFSYHMRPLELNRRFLVVFIRYLAMRPRPYLPSLTTHYTPTDSYPHHRTALPCSRTPHLPFATSHKRLHPQLATALCPTSIRTLFHPCGPQNTLPVYLVRPPWTWAVQRRYRCCR